MPLSHRARMRLAAGEQARLLRLLRGLAAAAWALPTDCAGWDVRAIAVHLMGNTMAAASPLEQLRPEEVVARLARLGPRSLTKRRMVPPVVRSVPVPFGPPFGTVRASFLLGTVLTRDAWMHRIDLARATGAELVLDNDDQLLVRDIAEEWARRHRTPVSLELTGPAGGRYVFGEPAAQALTFDAVEFCRVVAGREQRPGAAAGLLATRVAF